MGKSIAAICLLVSAWISPGLASALNPAAGGAEHPVFVVAQTQSAAPGTGSTVQVYRVENGRLVPDQVLLELAPGSVGEGNVLATDQVADYFFITYSLDMPGAVVIYNWRTGTIFPAVNMNPANQPTVDIAHGYSFGPRHTVCATWPIEYEASIYNFERKRWEGGSSLLNSVCVAPDQPPYLVEKDWSRAVDPVWPGGQIGNNLDGAFLLHRRGSYAIPASSQPPDLHLLNLPDVMTTNTSPEVLEVLAANEKFLVLSTSGKGRQTAAVLNRSTGVWTPFAAEEHSAYRIFGDYLADAAIAALNPEGDKVGRIYYQGKVTAVRNLQTGAVYPVEDGRDSEVLGISENGTMLLRDGNALYRMPLTQKDRQKLLVAKDDAIQNVHWAFSR